MKAKQATIALGLVAMGLNTVSADVYMHNPRGSNNRNCGTGENRRNGNRLFDSENNAKGGYACPRAKPFDCYKHYDDDAARAECNERNEDAGAAAIDRETGQLKASDAIATPTMYYYTGSILPIEWTNQHGAGTNSKLHSDIVIQVACEGTLTDDCGDVDSGETCGPRDGTPVNNQDEATTQVDTTVEDQLNYQRGRHETLRYYERCDNRERNKGLFAADQNINGNSAMYTRQNPNNNRQGLECKEEAHYYPYWHDSPWVDVAIITSNMERCLASAQQSQNVVGKNECVCDAEECEGRGNNPNNERACEEKGGDWVTYPAYSSYLKGVEAPECVEGVFSRVNHLGNVQGNGNPYTYNWTIPEYLAGNSSCVLRLRYNVSTGDGDSISVVGTSIHNGAQSPIKDRNNNEKLTYVGMEGLDIGDQAVLGLAVQTNQYGRTFQDRSYTFAVKPMPQDIKCDNVYNLNVRGKRGNIVQSYPSVEYDFVPSVLVAELDDCVHLQWTGSDYNPARNPNNGEGGPPDPTNLGAGRSDRHNMVQMSLESENRPVGDIANFTIFDTTDRPDLIKRLMFIDQPIDDPDQCLPFSEIQDLPGNQNDRERNHLNCGKLSGAKTPYFDAGLVKFSTRGTFRYMSTRNNNFTNRSQKGVIIVGTQGSFASALSGATGKTVGVAVGVLAGVGAAAIGFMKWNASGSSGSKKAHVPQINQSSTFNKMRRTSGAAAIVNAPANMGFHAKAGKVVTATYDHDATETGELTFKTGDRISVLAEDPSGWWTGRHEKTGATGIFPSNFCDHGSSVTGI